MEEERRLFYVGMTRAKEELILTTAGEPSLFLANLPTTVRRERLTAVPLPPRSSSPCFSGQQSTFLSPYPHRKRAAAKKLLGRRCVWFLCSRLSELTILPSPSRNNQENFFVLFSAYIFFWERNFFGPFPS